MMKSEIASRLRENPMGRWLLQKQGPIFVLRTLVQRPSRRPLKEALGVRRVPVASRSEFAPSLLEPAIPTGDFQPDWSPAWVRRVYDENRLELNREIYGIRVPGALVIGRHGWIRTADGEIADDLWDWTGHPSRLFDESLAEYAQTINARLAGTSGVLACPWAGNYWHFALQSLPRVSLVREYLGGAEPDHWIVQKARAPFVRELLGYAGVDPARVVELWSESVECEVAIGTTVPCENVYVPRWVADYLREIVPRLDLPDAPERLFVTRGATGGRDVANVRELSDLASRLGFRECAMDGLSVAGQAALFRSAKVVLAVHGAALTNLVYCEPGTLVIELTSVNYAWAAYHRLATTMGLRYFQVLGTELRQPLWSYRLQQGADMTANLAEVERILRAYGGGL